MVRNAHSALLAGLLFLLSFSLTGCGGTKVLKDPEPLVLTESLASATDETLDATLDWVIVRDGPGTWARNADWDEYLLTISNVSEESLRITGLTVVDMQEVHAVPGTNRKELVKATKKALKRYKGSGVDVKAGRGTGTMIAAGIGVTVVGVGVGTVAALGSTLGAGAAGAGTAGAVAGGLLLIGPALAVGGVVRGMNNSAVNNEIEQRQTLLPLTLEQGTEAQADVFFPISPSPRRVVLVYSDSGGEHRLVIDTSKVLAGLHIQEADN
ncbi:MAG: hypothetical protein OEM43_06595 [Gammaproteobacteria bacterium]|nr:hypothetical protein [Gammaproteobacteria bacterium]